jgi:hypothetical protein
VQRKRKARPVKVWLRASESPKEQKHVELKYMFIKHLIHDGILAIHKINAKHNPADILTTYVTREVLQ